MMVAESCLWLAVIGIFLTEAPSHTTPTVLLVAAVYFRMLHLDKKREEEKTSNVQAATPTPPVIQENV